MSDKDNLITTDNQLSDEEQRTFEVLVGTMIPADTKYGVPAADDPQILANILARAAELPFLTDALQTLDQLSIDHHGDRFSAVEDDDRVALLEEFGRVRPPVVRALFSITSQCYYQDDRVLESLGMQARAPFPDGFTLEQGDWSLLDPVRQRAKMYRE